VGRLLSFWKGREHRVAARNRGVACRVRSTCKISSPLPAGQREESETRDILSLEPSNENQKIGLGTRDRIKKKFGP